MDGNYVIRDRSTQGAANHAGKEVQEEVSWGTEERAFIERVGNGFILIQDDYSGLSGGRQRLDAAREDRPIKREAIGDGGASVRDTKG